MTEKKETWACKKCTYHNYDADMECEMCGFEREVSHSNWKMK